MTQYNWILWKSDQFVKALKKKYKSVITIELKNT